MNLFNRYRFCTVDEKEPDVWEAVSSFSDTFHEMKVSIIVKRQKKESPLDTRAFTIVSVKGEMKRYPDSPCLHTLEKLKLLKGLSLDPPVRRRIREILGGSQGCRQLEDLVLDAVQCFIQAEFVVRTHGITDPKERRRKFQKVMMDHCYLYSQPLS